MLTLPFLFSLGLEKTVQSSLEVSPVPGCGVPLQKEPCATPGAEPSWGTGSRGTGGRIPLWAHLLPTKAHNELSFKKAGENLMRTRQKAENCNSFKKLNGGKNKIRSPDYLSVIVSDLKQQASVAGRTPFDRVNILLFPILMFFRFSTCK